MTPAEARELVAQALESGEYKQGHGWLCAYGRYCCLGVATEVFMKHNPGIIETETPNVRMYKCGSAHEDRRLLEIVRRWLGFGDKSGFFNKDSLAALNDIGTSFTEIAKLFRNPPEGLLE